MPFKSASQPCQWRKYCIPSPLHEFEETNGEGFNSKSVSRIVEWNISNWQNTLRWKLVEEKSAHQNTSSCYRFFLAHVKIENKDFFKSHGNNVSLVFRNTRLYLSLMWYLLTLQNIASQSKLVNISELEICAETFYSSRYNKAKVTGEIVI